MIQYVAVTNDSNIRKKEQEKLEKYQGLKEFVQEGLRNEDDIGHCGHRSPCVVIPKLEEWLNISQEQHLRFVSRAVQC